VPFSRAAGCRLTGSPPATARRPTATSPRPGRAERPPPRITEATGPGSTTSVARVTQALSAFRPHKKAPAGPRPRPRPTCKGPGPSRIYTAKQGRQGSHAAQATHASISLPCLPSFFVSRAASASVLCACAVPPAKRCGEISNLGRSASLPLPQSRSHPRAPWRKPRVRPASCTANDSFAGRLSSPAIAVSLGGGGGCCALKGRGFGISASVEDLGLRAAGAVVDER
jgi:hypothetical protein